MSIIYVVYNFIHSSNGGNDDINIYLDYEKAKEEYNSVRKKYMNCTPEQVKCYVTEGNDFVRYDDHEYSVKIGIRKLTV